MRLRTPLKLLVVLAACWPAACTHRGRIQDEAAYPVGAVEVAPLGRMLERGQILPDVSAVDVPTTDSTTPSADQLYLAITEAECQCAAADHAEVANLIDLESQIAARCKRTRHASQRPAVALQAELLAYRSAALRNQAAAEALELFFLLAEAEAGRECLSEGLAAFEKISDYVTRLRDAGLEIDVAELAVDRRKAELLDRQAKLDLDRVRLNSELRRCQGLDVDDPTPIWPETDLKVEVVPIDIDTAITVGMSMRPEIAAAQRLLDCLDKKTLPNARGALQTFDAVLGVAAGKSCGLRLLCQDPATCEWLMREDQLQRMLVHLQRSAAEEIRQSVKAVETRLDQVAIAKQQLASREKTYEDLKLQWGSDAVTAFQIVDAELKMIEARQDLVHQVVAWEIAHVKLKQAQGLFALECGYTEPAEGFHPAAFMPATAAPEAEEGPVPDGPPPTPPYTPEPSPDLRQPDSLTEMTPEESSPSKVEGPYQPPADVQPEVESPRPVETGAEPPLQAENESSDQTPDVPTADDTGEPATFPRDPAIDTVPAPAAPAAPAATEPAEASPPPTDAELSQPAPLEQPPADDNAPSGTEEPRAPEDKVHSDVPPDDLFELDDTFLLDKTSRLRQPDSLRVQRMFTIELVQPAGLQTYRSAAVIGQRQPAGRPQYRRARPAVQAGLEIAEGPSEARARASVSGAHGPPQLRQPASVTNPGR